MKFKDFGTFLTVLITEFSICFCQRWIEKKGLKGYYNLPEKWTKILYIVKQGK